jgi:L-alanine-DL-glutamate epimerase-like enolase superfamily enzyme
MDAGALPAAKAQLLGKDPFDIEQHAPRMRHYVRDPRAVSSLEIALFDLMGKAARDSRFINSGDRRRTASQPMPG